MEVDRDKTLIKIIVINDIPYVWEASEWLYLRRDLRICGAFDGAGHQSTKPLRGHACPVLPLRLSRVQAHYLIKHGLALAFQLPVLNHSVPRVTREQVEDLREERRIEQLEAHKQKRRMQIESMVDKIIEGKRRKGRGIVPDRNTVIQEEIQKVELPFETAQIDLVDPWLKDTDFIPYDFPEPKTPLEKIRYRVFEDFHHRRKYYVTPGLKFGGDFMAYPEDPCVTHAEYIIVCHDTSRSPKPLYIESQIRLATVVKKVLLLATLDEKSDKLKYKVMNSINLKSSDRRLNNSKSATISDTEMTEPPELSQPQ